MTTLPVFGRSQTSDISDKEGDDADDELAMLEADMALGKKAVVQKTPDAKAEKEAAAEDAVLAKAKGIMAKKTAKEKHAATPAGGKAKAPPTKGKTGKGAVASSGKWKAVVSKGKTPAAVGVGPPGVFDIKRWIETHITRDEANAEPKRRNFVSNAHKRSHRAAKDCGVSDSSDFQPITKQAREAAGNLHDSLHKKK